MRNFEGGAGQESKFKVSFANGEPSSLHAELKKMSTLSPKNHIEVVLIT